MFDALSPLFRFRKSPKTTRMADVRARLELLEGRDVPTGNVIATTSGATLYLNAQVDAVVDANNDQEIVLTGNGSGSVIVQGQNGTSLNSGGGPVTFNGVKNVSINMNKGNDAVSVQALDLDGNVSFLGGEGIDQFAILNGATRIGGTLSINGGNGDSNVILGVDVADQVSVGSLNVVNGAGFDVLIVAGSDFTSAKTVSVNNGTGGGVVEFLSAATVTIIGNTTITNGAGDDTVVFGNTGTTAVDLNNLTINNGSGQGITVFDGLDHTIHGNLSVTNGSSVDADLFTATGASFIVLGKLTINNGSGGSQTVFQSDALTAIGGATTITNGGGDDQTLFGSPDGALSLGNVTINNGAGEGDTFFVASDQTIAGNILISNGVNTIGSDDFLVIGNSFLVLGTITINDGAGDTTTAFTAAASSVGGAFVENSGTGADTVVLAAAGFHNVTLNLNSGGSAVTIGQDVIVSRNLAVNAFDGADAISLSGEIVGNLTVNTNNGEDQVVASFLTVDGKTTVNTGNQNDTIAIDDSTFHGTVTANLGAGDDTVSIETVDTGAATTFDKAVSLYAGGGDDSVIIGIDDDLDDHAIFLGTCYADGGAGFDQLVAGVPKTNSFQVNPVLPGWEVKL